MGRGQGGPSMSCWPDGWDFARPLRARLGDRRAWSYQALVAGVGSPTLMKNLANDCERCSRYGGSNLNRFVPRSATSVSRKG